MTPTVLPDIPRAFTGVAEWAGVLAYILVIRPRPRGWRLPVLASVALPVMVGLQVLVGSWPLSLWMLGMFTAVISMVAFMWLGAGLSIRDTWYLTARAFVLAELIASLEWQLWVHYWNPGVPSPVLEQGAFLLSLAVLIGCYAVTFGAAWSLERRNFRGDRPPTVSMRALVTTLGIALATFMVSNLSFLTTNTPFSGRESTDIFYIRTLVDLAGFVALYSQQSNHNMMREAMELSETRMRMQAQHQQYLQSRRNIEELNRMHHDLKHYAKAIRAESDADRRSEYLQALEDSIRGYESEIRTGNSLLDVVLSSKMELCLQDRIQMTLMIDGSAVEFMDSMRLSTFFGNALDNAIEAARKIEDPDQRLIKVSVFVQGGFVLITVENHFPFAVEFEGGLPRTTKPDRDHHGYGTASMRSIAEHYGGSVTFTEQDGWFAVRALIPRRVADPAT